jgi:Na+/phosphate symporter
MSAKEKRELIGGGLAVIGLILLIIGVAYAESDYHNLNSTQLAAKTIAELLAPDFTMIGVGAILLGLGLAIFFAKSMLRQAEQPDDSSADENSSSLNIEKKATK